jgi:hypothetical protein
VDGSIRANRLRIVLWGCAFFYAGLYGSVVGILQILRQSDWSGFWGGGAMVGTQALVDLPEHFAFQVSHGLWRAIWPYPPAFAYVYAPFSHLPIVTGYFLHALLMLALGVVAGVVLADIFSVPRWFGVIAAIAWAPIKIAALSGQNTTLALLLIAIGMLGAKRGNFLIVGLAVGGLLYKPTIGVAFVALLLVRREWRALAVVALCAGAWYLLSVAATGGEWNWIPKYLAALRMNFQPDFLHDAHNAVSLPGVLMRFGVPATIAIGLGVALFVVFVPRLLRVDLVQAFAITSLLAVACSAHAWDYEAAIALPAIFYLMTILKTQARPWIVVAAYAIALASMFAIPGIVWNLQAIVVLGLTAVILVTPDPAVRQDDGNARQSLERGDHMGVDIA